MSRHFSVPPQRPDGIDRCPCIPLRRQLAFTLGAVFRTKLAGSQYSYAASSVPLSQASYSACLVLFQRLSSGAFALIGGLAH